MKLITTRTLIREIAHRWQKQHPNASRKDTVIGKTLNALDPDTATAEEVANIISNHTWTRVPACSECKQHACSMVELGESPDFQSDTAWVCRECLHKAVQLLAAELHACEEE